MAVVKIILAGSGKAPAYQKAGKKKKYSFAHNRMSITSSSYSAASDRSRVKPPFCVNLDGRIDMILRYSIVLMSSHPVDRG